MTSFVLDDFNDRISAANDAHDFDAMRDIAIDAAWKLSEAYRSGQYIDAAVEEVTTPEQLKEIARLCLRFFSRRAEPKSERIRKIIDGSDKATVRFLSKWAVDDVPEEGEEE